VIGKRLLRKWLCHPLRNIADINDRLNAVEDFMKFSHIAGNIHIDSSLPCYTLILTMQFHYVFIQKSLNDLFVCLCLCLCLCLYVCVCDDDDDDDDDDDVQMK
jgi:hypothetical protein